jgi:hypothetical protein
VVEWYGDIWTNADDFWRCRSQSSIIPQWITTHGGIYPSGGSIPDAAYSPIGMSVGKLFSGGRLQRSGWTGVSSLERSGRVSFFLSLCLSRRRRRCSCGIRSYILCQWFTTFHARLVFAIEIGIVMDGVSEVNVYKRW